jgi:hypothetical protein
MKDGHPKADVLLIKDHESKTEPVPLD